MSARLDQERLSVLLFNAICGLEKEGYTKEMVLAYCSMTSEEYNAVMGTEI